MKKVPIAVAPGDGIGKEIMHSVLTILKAANAPLEYRFVEMGKEVFESGFSTGMTPESQKIIEETGVLLKGPMETPKGKGVKSINVTARKVWNTYANKRVFKTLAGVETVFSKAGIPIDLTIIRENIEDTYGGIEHMLTQDVALCRRFITRPGSMQLHKYAFEVARKKGAKKITCGHKANIMKLTDGLFLECFYEVAKDYPELEANDIIVDDLAMKLVVKPQSFEVVVLPNLQGDIISDLCAGLVGGLGFAPSANIGDHISIFEAVHGTAPDISGHNIANPTALLLSSIMMLRHLNMVEHATLIENALLATLEAGYRTQDFCKPDQAHYNTTAFAHHIIDHFGKKPIHLPAEDVLGSQQSDSEYKPVKKPKEHKVMVTPLAVEERIMGVDVFVESVLQPAQIAELITAAIGTKFQLTTISNRGTQVWPTGSFFTECINQFRVRIECHPQHTGLILQNEMLELVQQIAKSLKICSTEFLMEYAGKKAYSLAQGQ